MGLGKKIHLFCIQEMNHTMKQVIHPKYIRMKKDIPCKKHLGIAI